MKNVASNRRRKSGISCSISNLALGVALVLGLAAPVLAEEGAGEVSPPPPVIGEGGEAPEPEVTIVSRPDGQVREYRVNGQLYMIEVIPKKGPRYYLVDTNGDGNLDLRRGNLEPTMLIPRWTILRWK